MSEIEESPDPNQIRRHQKKMLTELQYRQKYRRIDFFKPHPKQLEFLSLNAPEAMLRAGNQTGKTMTCGAKMAFDALALYPEWYRGRRFDKKLAIERSHEFVGWAASTTSAATRDNLQMKLLGDISQADGLGTGLIPLDNIVSTTSARGISNFVDTITLRRESGGGSIIRLKTYEQGRRAFQGEAVDLVWLDEDPSHGSDDDEIYGECLARLTATSGQIIASMTPVLGRTPIRKRFSEGDHPGCVEVVMGLDDALHIPPEERATILARYKASERATRAYGADLQGMGAVFEIPEDAIKHTRDAATFPHYWRWLWALDFSHAGLSASGHPFAAVLGAHDPDNDVIYVVHALRMRQSLPINHVAAIRQHPCFDAPIAWPHDGNRNDLGSGANYASHYKKLGLLMLPTHATFKEGAYSFEAGITDMENRMATGRLLIASHLSEWFDEYRNYHRRDGLVHKVDDDLLSATRILCMQIRSARPLDPNRPGQPGAYRGWDGSFRRGGRDQIASDVEFDVFTGGAR